MSEIIAEHVIREITDPLATVRSFYLEPPTGGRRQAALITFSPEGITITGDMRPGAGVLSPKGYDLHWFLTEVPAEDLYAAFGLNPHGWHPDLAVKELKQLCMDLDATAPAGLQKLVQLVETGEVLQDRMILLLVANSWCGSDTAATIGIGYDPWEAGWLVAIQQRFREAWQDFRNNALA